MTAGNVNAATVLWTAGVDGNWATAANWTSDAVGNPHVLPGSSDTARFSNATLYETTVDSNVGTVNQIQFANDASNDKGALRIKANGALIATQNITSSNKDNGQSFIYQEGGTLTTDALNWGRVAGGAGNPTISRFYMSGGTFTATTIIGLGGSTSSGNGYGEFYQSNGTVNTATLSLDSLNSSTASKGYYEISGGALNVSSAIRNGTGVTSDDGTFSVIGSKATIGVSGASGTYGQGANSKLLVSLDNGGISKINLVGASSTATLSGTLSAGFKAGAALTTTTSFRVIEAKTVNGGGFTTLPNSTLWSGSVQSVEGSRQAFVLSYQASAKQGSDISVSGTSSTSFAGTSRGYATITGLSLDENINLLLDVTMGSTKSVGDLIAYFNLNGLTATAGTGGYDIDLAFLVGANGNSYFGWDLNTFDATGTTVINGLAVSAVPEPSTVWLISAALGAFVIVARKRRRRALS